MDPQYIPQRLEQEIQQFWSEKQVFKATEDFNKEKFYCLAMIPYPSGNLHIGHARNYTISDVIARYQKMLGKNVMQPFGWDAFGLPAENAALKHKTAPAKWTYENIKHMRQQLKTLGLGIDWSHEITTCDPEYYHWEQWLFIQMLKKGLAYKKLSTVNWDPVDQTVLANEQVVDGKGWRSGAPVERKEISQWFLKISAYADELLKDLDQLDNWPEQVRTMQKNWIGRSEGCNIDFDLCEQENTKITVFTTRADTLMGVTYLTIAPEHPIAKAAAENNPELKSFLKTLEQNTKTSEADIATQEKLGMFTGYYVTHPVTQEKLPLWVANYVLYNYGSGAVMAVPAHDERDFEFAQKYNLPIKTVITPKTENNEQADHETLTAAYTETGILINSDKFNGMDSEQARTAIADYLIDQKHGEKVTNYRLHDWGISRQRYWGAPIPIIHCEHCGAVPVPEEDLPVRLPESVDFEQGLITLKDLPEFYKTICPKCGENAQRETDTFDTFMESSWYYAKLACPDQEEQMLDSRAKYWAPVDQYIGGIEHAVMHLLYARFIHKVLRDEGLVNSDEPFKKLLTQGMVLKDGTKMSKSKGNVVDPDSLIKQYGADSVRLFVIFTAPPEQSLEWSDSGFEGCFRFLKRLWVFAQERQGLFIDNHNGLKVDKNKANEKQLEQWREIHSILKQANHDYDRNHLNTVVSGSMKLFNLLSKISYQQETNQSEAETNHALIYEGTKILLAMLSPIAPHICQQLWLDLELGDVIAESTWPKVNSAALASKMINLVIQVNGKLRSKICVASDADNNSIESAALADPAINKFTENKTVRKVIVVPQRLVNIVVTD